MVWRVYLAFVEHFKTPRGEELLSEEGTVTTEVINGIMPQGGKNRSYTFVKFNELVKNEDKMLPCFIEN